MKKTSLGVAAAAVALAFSALASSSASAVAVSGPGQVTTTQQLTSTNMPVPVKGDFDGDGRDDVFWYVAGSGTDYLWSGKVRDDTSGTTIADRFAVSTLPISGVYTPIVGDFNGDDRDDILWYSPGSGPDSIWYFTGRGTVSGKSLTINGNYKAVVGDFDATDGINADDIFWYNNSSSYLWTSNANETFSSVAISDPPDNAKVYVGNFRQTAVSVGAPEYLDILFYVAGTGADAIWAGNGDGGFTKSAVTINGSYNPIIGNFDANPAGVDMTDIFWYGPGTAPDSVWMNTGSSFTTRAATVNGTYSPMVVPSKESTTQDDIFWDSKTAGDFLWVTNGNSTAFSYSSMTPSAWGGTDIGTRNGIAGDFNAADPTGASSSTQLSVGASFACAATATLEAKCWGYNANGQLGNGTSTTSSIPVKVTGLSGVSAVEAGSSHACAVDFGAAKCWGYNASGQLGNGLTTTSSTPVQVTGLTSGVSDVTPGEFHTCALQSGAAKCWGNNSYGQLGNSTNTGSLTAVSVTGLTSGVIQIDAGIGSHTCATVGAGAAKCWGLNTNGQLGNGTTTNANAPVQVTGLTTGVVKVEAGNLFSCALTSAGAVKCWGDNAFGQLGNGTTTASTTPVQVTGLTANVWDLSVGLQGACAYMSNGDVKCWGRNNYGQLGNGNTTDQTSPVLMSGIVGTSAYAAMGSVNSCVIVTLGRIECSGAGGGLGNGGNTDSSSPQEVAGGRTFGTFGRPLGNADVLWWGTGDGTADKEIMWYDLDSLT